MAESNNVTTLENALARLNKAAADTKKELEHLYYVAENGSEQQKQDAQDILNEYEKIKKAIKEIKGLRGNYTSEKANSLAEEMRSDFTVNDVNKYKESLQGISAIYKTLNQDSKERTKSVQEETKAVQSNNTANSEYVSIAEIVNKIARDEKFGQAEATQQTQENTKAKKENIEVTKQQIEAAEELAKNANRMRTKNGGSADWSLGEELLKAAGIDIKDTLKVVEENTKATQENTEAKKRNVKATEENTEAKKENVKATTEESTTTEEVITKKQKNVKQIQEETSNIVNQTKAWKDNYAAFKDTQEVAMGKFTNSFGTTISQSQKLSTEFDKLKKQLLEVSSSGDKKQFLIDFDKFQKDVRASAQEIKVLTTAKENLIRQLDNWEIKNKEIVDSNTDINQLLQDLRENINNIGDSEGVDNAKKKFTELNTSVKQTNDNVQSLKTTAMAYATDLANASELLKSKLIDGLYQVSVQALREIVKEVQVLDAALVEIRKVTDFTTTELNTFVNEIKQVGNATATMTSDLLEASATFARSGYTKEQIVQLTEEAAILKNVSDGITDMGQAAQTLISIMKAYKVPASQARTITDQLNNISNNAAISFDDLAEGIQRTGAVFASAGTSIGQLSALLTGANEVLQNIEKTSTGLSTISERIRGIKGATEDGIGVAKLDEMMSVITSRYGQAVHVINESNGQLRSTYDILADLAKVWDRLSLNERQELGEKIAG